MADTGKIINRVAESDLITFNPEDYRPDIEIGIFDIKPYLFNGLLLKEKEFRSALINVDWEKFRNKNVAIHCTADAIVPVWSYLLVASYLNNVHARYEFGTSKAMFVNLYKENLRRINTDLFKNKKVMVKGCSHDLISEEIYVAIAGILLPHVRSLMFGEACSNIPIFKNQNPDNVIE